MNDMRSTIIPKSDQLNYDDLIGGQTKTIKITGVQLTIGDQPAALNYENDQGKPYKPCKSMRRVLVYCWGDDANKYVGRSLTLYGDPKVMFGGVAVGGIRISNMSDIKEPITMALTTTRSQRKPFTVKPLFPAPEIPDTDQWEKDIFAADSDSLPKLWSHAQRVFKDNKDFARIHEAKELRKKQLTEEIIP